jgi:RNA polymerase sigma factor (sigma-70 family)
MSDKTQTCRLQWIRSTVSRYEGPLIRYTTGITGDLETAREVVQDAFLRLCEADYDKVNGHLAPWLYTVCRNRAIDIGKKENRMVALTEVQTNTTPDVTDDPSVVLDRKRTHGRLQLIIGSLPDNQKEVIRLKFQEELSYKEIGQVMDLTAGNVGYLIHTAIRNIRNKMTAAEIPAGGTGGQICPAE